jgi:hypothetical protein
MTDTIERITKAMEWQAQSLGSISQRLTIIANLLDETNKHLHNITKEMMNR